MHLPTKYFVLSTDSFVQLVPKIVTNMRDNAVDVNIMELRQQCFRMVISTFYEKQNNLLSIHESEIIE